MQTTLHYSEALVRKAIKTFWWRKTGWSFFIPMLLLCGFLCYELWQGNYNWWVGVLGAVLALAFATAAVLYVVHFRGAITRFRRMQKPEALFEMGEEKFRLSSDVGTTELVWSTITEVWRFPEFWLLFFSPAQFSTIPIVDLPQEAQELLLAKVTACGAKVS